ncbi:hypothetical protein Tco_1425525, partial [Tanacetum coccineum]
SIAQLMKFNINQRHGGWKDLKIHHRIYHITGSSSTPTSLKNTREHRHMGSRSVWIDQASKDSFDEWEDVYICDFIAHA